MDRADHRHVYLADLGVAWRINARVRYLPAAVLAARLVVALAAWALADRLVVEAWP
jgi:hypothetical protein